MNHHLDDETLSALLDGEVDAEDRDHARGCERCALRLQQLQDGSRAVAAPPPPPSPERREAMIAAALATASPPHGAGPPGAPPSAPAPRRTPAPAARGRWLAAAAVVAALTVAVPVVRSQLGPDADQQLAAGDPSASTTSVPTGDAPAAQSIHHLGEIDLGSLRADPPTLAELQGGPVPQHADGYAEATPSAPGAAGSRRAEQAAPAGEAAPLAGGSTCEATVRRRHPEAGRLAYAAGATVDGAPAEVLGFEAVSSSGGEGAGDLLVVVAPGSCDELAVVPLGR